MAQNNKLKFGVQTEAAGEPGATDAQFYDELYAECDAAADLGYDSAWILEHHFSDWFPTPDPLFALANLAPRYPSLELGTDVIVTPWHEPLRLAEQIHMLSVMSEQHLHLGLGRGTAKLEYDAFGVPMEESRVRFKESWDILQKALSGETFTYEGEIYRITRPIRVRPEANRDRLTFYGAIGSPDTAALMAEWGLPPICTSATGDIEKLTGILTSWKASAQAKGFNPDSSFAVQVVTIVEDTDDKAMDAAKRYIPDFNKALIKHYEIGKTEYGQIRSFEAWQRTYQGLFKFLEPANIPEWAAYQFVGSPETVRGQLQRFVDSGFNHVILHSLLPGVPRADRRRWLQLFASEVIPAIQPARALVA